MPSYNPDLPTLIVVMGTSGSGKSTLGLSLAKVLDVPFVDGDDLHPASNVDKMAKGVPLTDADRLPWLLTIRQKALQLCGFASDADSGGAEERGGQTAASKAAAMPSDQLRHAAEQYETSHQPKGHDPIVQEAESLKRDTSSEQNGQQATGSAEPVGTSPDHQHPKACVIACSALKRSYRDLLRYGLSHIGEEKSGSSASQHALPATDLNVFHVYVKVTPENLLRRMHERKNHFMKENMLRSQLDTLEEPVGEENVLLLEDADVATLTSQGKEFFDRTIQ